jgi:hypothetical protein
MISNMQEILSADQIEAIARVLGNTAVAGHVKVTHLRA